jgi:cysteine desulfurase/selenocysteine lyase
LPIDVQRARQETPGCATVLHLNNAGAALMPAPVLDATIGHLQLEATIGGYEAAERASGATTRAYEALARLLGCDGDEVAIVDSATRAWNNVFYALPFAPGDRILTSAPEYGSNYLAMLQVARRTGAHVEVIPGDESGAVDLSALERALAAPARLIALTHVPSNGGLVNPAAAVGQLAGAAGVPYLLDACQSVGQMPVDVRAIGCDFLTGTSRKYLRGPRGIGFLYVRRERLTALEPPFLSLHAAEWVGPDRYAVRADARRFETWETDYAARIGFGVAVEYALGWGLDAIWSRVRDLADRLRAGLSALPGVAIRDLGRERCGIVTLTAAGHEPAALQRALAAARINVSVATAAYTPLDMDARSLPALLRASVHYYNTEAEIDRCCAALAAVLAHPDGPPPSLDDPL